MNRAIAGIIVLLGAVAAHAEDLQVTVNRKTSGFANAQDTLKGAKGSTAAAHVQNQKWKADVKVQNRTSKDMEEMEVHYNIFVKRQELGQKVGEDKIEVVKGDSKIPVLKSQAAEAFEMSEVELHQSTLLGNVMFKNGGQQRVADDVLGVWIKFTRGGTDVSEYMNPPGLNKKHKFE
ncbi:MAG: hypothetical protein WCO60_10815 [Verrucomicrobiota bacterium]